MRRPTDLHHGLIAAFAEPLDAEAWAGTVAAALDGHVAQGCDRLQHVAQGVLLRLSRHWKIKVGGRMRQLL